MVDAGNVTGTHHGRAATSLAKGIGYDQGSMAKAPVDAGSPYLVYTSAGDHSNVRQWIQGTKTFDLWITYYGDRPGHLNDVADYYNARKGSKFQNLHHVYQTSHALLQTYRAVFVLDDDIEIDAWSINRLFEVRDKYDYWAVQPAFEPRGKISHDITRVRRTCLRRHTNFVEMGCSLFRRDILDEFMKVYDGSLGGWGIDWWYLHVMGENRQGKVAIVDEIVCANPHDRTKGGREIFRLQPRAALIADWERVKRAYELSDADCQSTEYERFRKPLGNFMPRCAADVVSDTYFRIVAAVRPGLRRGVARFADWRPSHRWLDGRE